MKAWGLPEGEFLEVSHGSAVSSISSKMPVHMSLDRACELRWLQIFVTSSMVLIGPWLKSTYRWSFKNMPNLLLGFHHGWKQIYRKGSPSLTFRADTDGLFEQQTAWNGSIVKFAGEPGSWESSRMKHLV